MYVFIVYGVYGGLEPPMSNNNDLTKQILAIAAFSGLIGGFFSPDAMLFELFEDLDPEELDELIDYLIEN